MGRWPRRGDSIRAVATRATEFIGSAYSPVQSGARFNRFFRRRFRAEVLTRVNDNSWDKPQARTLFST